MNKTHRNNAGFTLIEIMIVIAIIGIIAAIAIPNFNQYRQKSLKQLVVSTVRNTASLEEAYFATNQLYYAFVASTGPVKITFPNSEGAIHVSKKITLSATTQADGSLKIFGSHPGIVGQINYDTSVGVVQ